MMASFISALSLLILVLANSCFTVPVVDEQLWSSTLSSLTNDLTTEKVLNLALVSDDDTTGLPSMEPKRSAYEHAEFGMSNSTDSLLVENASRASRAFDEFTTSESFPDKRDHDELLSTTVESTTQVLEHALRTLKSSSEDEIEPETETGKGDYQKSWSTKVESNGQSNKRESQTLKINSEDGNIKSEMQVELTTSFMPSFTSTSSAVAPELYTSESSTSTSTSSSTSTSTSTSSSTSTEKYTGHLPHEVEEGEEPQHHEKVEDEEEQQKPLKKQTKTKLQSKVTPIRKTEIQSEDKLEEDLKETPFKISTTGKPKVQTEDKPEEELKETPFKISTTRQPKVQTEDKPEEDLKESQFKTSTTRKPKVQTEDKPEEDFEESQSKISTTRKSEVQPTDDSKESSFPTAVFDQDASNKVSNVPNGFMMLDETDSPIVTDRPDKLSTVTMENQTKPKLLNQGKKSSQPEEKESDH